MTDHDTVQALDEDAAIDLTDSADDAATGASGTDHDGSGADVPEVPEFLQMLSDMGANLWACQMSVDMMGLEKDDLFDEVIDVINVSEFMELSEGAQIIFV